MALTPSRDGAGQDLQEGEGDGEAGWKGILTTSLFHSCWEQRDPHPRYWRQGRDGINLSACLCLSAFVFLFLCLFLSGLPLSLSLLILFLPPSLSLCLCLSLSVWGKTRHHQEANRSEERNDGRKERLFFTIRATSTL